MRGCPLFNGRLCYLAMPALRDDSGDGHDDAEGNAGHGPKDPRTPPIIGQKAPAEIDGNHQNPIDGADGAHQGTPFLFGDGVIALLKKLVISTVHGAGTNQKIHAAAHEEEQNRYHQKDQIVRRGQEGDDDQGDHAQNAEDHAEGDHGDIAPLPCQ